MTLLLFAGAGVPTGGTFAEFTVEIAFGYTWRDENPTWVDVTGYVEFDPGFTIERGRSRELDTFQTGSAGFTLRNDDRRFDPEHASSPYYGLLKPRVPVRIRGEYNSTTYDLFTGYIDGWPQAYTNANEVAVVDITASDAFKILEGLDLISAAFTLDSETLGVLDQDRLAGPEVDTPATSGERINTLLDVAGWPSTLRDIADGSGDCQGQATTGGALDALRLVETSEDGYLYVESDGSITFAGRHDPQFVARMAGSQVTFSDADTDWPYDDLRFIYDDQLIYNDVRRTAEGGVEQSVEDGDSINDYARRTDSKTGLLVTSDPAARGLAVVFLDRYKDPTLRVDQLVIDPLNSPEYLWPVVLGQRILNRVTVERTPQQVGSVISKEMVVQGIRHDWAMFQWRTTYYVTPVSQRVFFALDDPAYGVLDEDLIGA